MMNLLFSSVYERAKQTDKKVIFAIDEARYIMRDKSALEFLEQAVRHSRHYDLSIQFITQTVDEFFQHPESEAIADQCDHKLFFHTEGVDEDVADRVGMNDIQARFVRNATPGDEETGYSEAAFQVADDGWYPVHVRAMDTEAAIVDLDPTDDIETALPGMGDGDELPARVKQLREYLQSQRAASVHQQRSEATADEPPIPERKVPTDDGVDTQVDREALNATATSIEDVLASHIDADIESVSEGDSHPHSDSSRAPNGAGATPPGDASSQPPEDAIPWSELLNGNGASAEAALYEQDIYTAVDVLDAADSLPSIEGIDSADVEVLFEFSTAAAPDHERAQSLADSLDADTDPDGSGDTDTDDTVDLFSDQEDTDG